MVEFCFKGNGAGGGRRKFLWYVFTDQGDTAWHTKEEEEAEEEEEEVDPRQTCHSIIPPPTLST